MSQALRGLKEAFRRLEMMFRRARCNTLGHPANAYLEPSYCAKWKTHPVPEGKGWCAYCARPASPEMVEPE